MTCSLDLFLCVAFRAGTTDAIFISSKIQEKYIGKNSNLYFAFVDLEKVFDRVPGKVGPMIGWSVRKVGPMVSQSVRKVGPMVSQPVGQKGRSYGWSVGQKGWSYSQLVGQKGWSYGWSFGQKGWSYGRSVLWSVGQSERSILWLVDRSERLVLWLVGRLVRKVGPMVGFNESSHARVDCTCGSDNVSRCEKACQNKQLVQWCVQRSNRCPSVLSPLQCRWMVDRKGMSLWKGCRLM